MSGTLILASVSLEKEKQPTFSITEPYFPIGSRHSGRSSFHDNYVLSSIFLETLKRFLQSPSVLRRTDTGSIETHRHHFLFQRQNLFQQKGLIQSVSEVMILKELSLLGQSLYLMARSVYQSLFPASNRSPNTGAKSRNQLLFQEVFHHFKKIFNHIF